MLTETDKVKMIFGLKVQQLRREQDLSYQQLSDRTGLALSYLHNIEKGKKYPKADKILALARALGVEYNYLVSLDAGKKLQPIIDLLQSDFLKVFPLEEFGIDTQKLIELLAQTPDKVQAFISTVIKITRNYHLQGEDFYKAALRSYQDMHDNHFPELERAVRAFKEAERLPARHLFTTAGLERLLQKRGIRVDRALLPRRTELSSIRSYFDRAQNTLFLNASLSPAQENFLLAKELGFQHLALTERPYETRMVDIDSFDKLLNNFRASYFSVALLLDEVAIVEEVEQLARQERWQPALLAELLDKYGVTPEMLLQRLANILPAHFGVNDLFFLRFYTGPDMHKYIMTKEMHLSQLHNPHANQLDEHYCRRWISINIIRQLRARQGIEDTPGPIADAQVSRYWGSKNSYLCFAMATVGRDDPDGTNSVTIGLLVNERLRRLFRFLDDPALRFRDVHTTCERCPISECEARAYPPVHLERERAERRIVETLAALPAELRVENGN